MASQDAMGKRSEKYPPTITADPVAARAYCDKAPLMDPEGLWEYPEFNVQVLIVRDDEDASSFGIWIIDSENCTLSPGDRLGTLSPSLKTGEFKLNIFTSVKNGKLCASKDALASFSEKDEAIFVDKFKIKFSFNPFGFLPSHLRRLFRLKTENPADKIKTGLKRIYPSYDGNGNSRRRPIYL